MQLKSQGIPLSALSALWANVIFETNVFADLGMHFVDISVNAMVMTFEKLSGMSSVYNVGKVDIELAATFLWKNSLCRASSSTFFMIRRVCAVVEDFLPCFLLLGFNACVNVCVVSACLAEKLVQFSELEAYSDGCLAECSGAVKAGSCYFPKLQSARNGMLLPCTAACMTCFLAASCALSLAVYVLISIGGGCVQGHIG